MSVVSVRHVIPTERLDSQFFRKAYLTDDHELDGRVLRPIGEFAFVTDGPHGYHEIDRGSSIAMLTATCASDWFANREAADTIGKWVDDANRRSSLQVDDLVLSTRGTVGKCAVVTAETLPANIDQDLARIAVQPGSPFWPHFVLAYLNCRFGQDYIRRHSSGMVQQGLSLAKVRDIPIPLLSDHFQRGVSRVVAEALLCRRKSHAKLVSAEEAWLGCLGLPEWAPAAPRSYIARARDVFAADRMDAGYFSPRVQALLDAINRDGHVVGNVATSRRERFRPVPHMPFNYIEIGSVDGTGGARSVQLRGDAAPSRAKWIVSSEDVITSTVRPIRRLTARIEPEQDGHVCSSGFIVMDPHSIAAEALVTYLRLPVICELLDMYAGASMYPAISEKHILGLPLPRLEPSVEAEIAGNVQMARELRAQAAELLLAAQCAVETAVEAGEPDAMVVLGLHGDGTR